MKHHVAVTLFFIILTSFPFYASSCSNQTDPSIDNENKLPPEILVFTKTEGYRHASIPDGVAALKQLGEENGWDIEHTEEAGVFTSDSLNDYTAVIFLNTTGDILNDAQQTAFESYIRRGHGFAGIHSATDTEYEWDWYGLLVGAYFDSHPQIQKARLVVQNPDHLSTRPLPEVWVRTDEWYNFREISPDIQVLLQLDESSYEGGSNGDFHPAAWYQEFDGGRVFYTAGGHTSESYSNDLFLKHLQGGIRYVIGSSD